MHYILSMERNRTTDFPGKESHQNRIKTPQPTTLRALLDWLNKTSIGKATTTSTIGSVGTPHIIMNATLSARESRIAEQSVLNSQLMRMRGEPE
jgi:hypothetical protein